MMKHAHVVAVVRISAHVVLHCANVCNIGTYSSVMIQLFRGVDTLKGDMNIPMEHGDAVQHHQQASLWIYRSRTHRHHLRG